MKDNDIDDLIANVLRDEDFLLDEIINGDVKKVVDSHKNVDTIGINGKRSRKGQRDSDPEKCSTTKRRRNKDNTEKVISVQGDSTDCTNDSNSKKKRKKDDEYFVWDLNEETKASLNTDREGMRRHVFCQKRQFFIYHNLCSLYVSSKCKKLCKHYDFGLSLKNDLGIKRRKIIIETQEETEEQLSIVSD